MAFKRRVVREKVLQLLFAYEYNSEHYSDLIESTLSDFEEKDFQFGKSLINKVILNINDFDNLINAKLTNWELDRVALLDRILLRMAICELTFFEDIPPKVSINEAIELAKEYSTAKSSKFINGILDAILSDFKNNSLLNKTGRGLLDATLPKTKS